MRNVRNTKRSQTFVTAVDPRACLPVQNDDRPPCSSLLLQINRVPRSLHRRSYLLIKSKSNSVSSALSYRHICSWINTMAQFIKSNQCQSLKRPKRKLADHFEFHKCRFHMFIYHGARILGLGASGHEFDCTKEHDMFGLSRHQSTQHALVEYPFGDKRKPRVYLSEKRRCMVTHAGFVANIRFEISMKSNIVGGKLADGALEQIRIEEIHFREAYDIILKIPRTSFRRGT